MRICELREKEVINICDCRKLGRIEDVNIDNRNGQVREIIIPETCKPFCLFGDAFEYVIPWCCIRQIGADIILVEANIKDIRKKCD